MLSSSEINSSHTTNLFCKLFLPLNSDDGVPDDQNRILRILYVVERKRERVAAWGREQRVKWVLKNVYLRCGDVRSGGL